MESVPEAERETSNLRLLATAASRRYLQPAGATGQQGPAGPQGPQGEQGDPGVSGLQIVSVTSSTSSVSPKAVEASCPPGKVIIGGGAELHGPTIFGGTADGSVALVSSRPATSTTWEAIAREIVYPNNTASPPSTGQTWSLTSYAICATVSP